MVNIGSIPEKNELYQDVYYNKVNPKHSNDYPPHGTLHSVNLLPPPLPEYCSPPCCLPAHINIVIVQQQEEEEEDETQPGQAGQERSGWEV